MADALRRRSGDSSGFTLLEMMITVAIVGILAAIALPAYFDFVMRSKIIDATSVLANYRSSMEKYFMDNRTYLLGATCGIVPPTADYFTITCGPPAPTATTYTLTATGNAAKGMGGFAYTIDQANNKVTTGVPVASGWSGTGNTCWVLRKDGSC